MSTGIYQLTSQVGLQVDKSTIEKIADKDSYSIRKDKLRSIVNGASYLPDGGFHKQTDTESSQVTWKAMGVQIFNNFSRTFLWIGVNPVNPSR